MLHPQAQALLDLIAERGLPAMHTLTPVEARVFYRDRRGFTQPLAPEVGSVRDTHCDGPHGPIPLRLYRPLARAGMTASDGVALPVLVYFHGGGWTIGDLDTHDVLCRELCHEAGVAVVAVDYRMGPEDPFPAAVDDCLAATYWVRRNARELGVDPTRLAVGGDSAGGNLAAVVAIAARDAGDLPIAYQLLIYPATDMRRGHPSHTTNGSGYLLTTETISYYHDHYIAMSEHDLDWRASPLLRDDLSRLPPALGADRRLRPVARRRPGLRRSPCRFRQPGDVRLLRAPDPRLHHDGQGDRRSSRGGAPVRGRARASARALRLRGARGNADGADQLGDDAGLTAFLVLRPASAVS